MVGRMKLQGIFAAITTPFDHKGDIYRVKVQHNVEKWNRTALAGYVVCAAAGESALLSGQEKLSVWEMVAKHAAPEKLLVAAGAMPGVHETVSLINGAAEMGYQAALIDAPHHPPETQLLYFRAVADQSRIPVIVAGVEGEVAWSASEHPNVVAVCSRTGHPARPEALALAGSESNLWTALESGAAGAVLDFAAAAPYACIAVWEAHRTREHEAGLDWQNRIRRAAELLDAGHYGVPGLKHAMDLHAYYGGPPRLPLVVPSAEARREIEEAFRDLPTDR